MSLIEKPLVVKKFREFYQHIKNNDGKIGTKQRGIDLNLNNACNLRCEHCFTLSPKGDHAKEVLSPEIIARIADAGRISSCGMIFFTSAASRHSFGSFPILL